MEKALQLENVISELNDFCEREYGHEPQEVNEFMKEAIESNMRIQIAETSWGEHEDFTVEVYFDVTYLALRKHLYRSNGLTYTESKWYNNKEVAIEHIKGYEFDSLTVFEEDTDWLIEKLS